MKELLLVILVLLFSGIVAGCAGRGYEGYYGGAYAGYNSSFPLYGYPYGYYDAFSPRFFHSPSSPSDLTSTSRT